MAHKNVFRSLSARDVPFPDLWFPSFPVGYFQWLLCCFHSGIKPGSNEKQVLPNFKFLKVLCGNCLMHFVCSTLLKMNIYNLLIPDRSVRVPCCSGLFRTCSGLFCACSGLFRTCSGLFHACSGLFRTCSGLFRACSGVPYCCSVF